MKVLKKLVCFVFFFAGGLLGLVLLIAAFIYATSPIYTFKEPKPFSGENFYNPYQKIDSGEWRKCVFHLHTRELWGFMNGTNTPEEVLKVYKTLHFDVVGISKYMEINNTDSDNPFYIPVYEHGYGIKKVHYLALGARRVLWRDFILSENLNQKQYMIDLLKKTTRYVAMNHPNTTGSYLPDDFRYLSGYDLFELQSGRKLSEKQWDIALSSGHRVWLIADDDAHSVTNLDIVQREVTFVNTSEPTGDAVLESLVRGEAFGVHFPNIQQATWKQKEQAVAAVSFPVSINVSGDSLCVHWNKKMQEIDFIGDSGKLLKTVTNSDTSCYLIRPENTYVRVKIASSDGFIYYLNPVIRSAGGMPALQLLSGIDTGRTLRKRFFIAFCCATIAVCGFVLRRKRNAQKPEISNFKQNSI